MKYVYTMRACDGMFNITTNSLLDIKKKYTGVYLPTEELDKDSYCYLIAIVEYRNGQPIVGLNTAGGNGFVLTTDDVGYIIDNIVNSFDGAEDNNLIFQDLTSYCIDFWCKNSKANQIFYNMPELFIDAILNTDEKDAGFIGVEIENDKIID